MKVKKYIASTLSDAMQRIRKEFGDDAVILQSKEKNTGGILGLFKKKQIEVIAAIDPEPLKNTNKRPPSMSSHTNTKVSESEADKSVSKQLADLNALIRRVAEKQSGVLLPEPVQAMAEILERQEVDPVISQKIVQQLVEKWYASGGKASRKETAGWLAHILKQSLAHLSFGGNGYEKKFINVVGPTGVGKTTTLAKMAAEAVLTHQKKIAFLTTDTYRIAAIDQLKIYANILNVPMEVCYSLADFKAASNKLKKEADVIFIDTAGRNFRNHRYVKDLQSVIDFQSDMETYLVFALTAKQGDMEEIYQQFSILPVDRFIFTKEDETSTFGAMYNMIRKYQKGAAFMTNGQNVPDDMYTASADVIVNKLLGDEK
ncbi:flagellar biosynthesis protein FlhF [Bacillaceae bacterium Marseille-Q3522]|nr:flagellar biosynthesis protein FlhF [Bacillaceae bacterium Marseille-Q3522]